MKLNAIMTKSSGYKKRDLKSINAELQAFANKLIANYPQEYTDVLCNNYSAIRPVNGKSALFNKYDVVKGVKLTDRNRSVDFKEMEQMTATILFKHIDSTKYYRIKSGLLGTRDTVLSPDSFNGKKAAERKEKRNELSSFQSAINTFTSDNTLKGGSKLNFIMSPELYEYAYQGATQNEKDEWIYVIGFTPKKKKGKYAGTLYISQKDYAVVRTDYALGEGKTLGGVNLKFLFGVKQSENVSRGTLIFKERDDESGYYLKYGSLETGSYIYINRPLKLIEITEGEKDKVAFDIKTEADMLDKEEYFIMSQSEAGDAEFDAVKEHDFDYIHLDTYDPNTWKEYTTIEPVQEMKRFKTIE